MYQSLHNNYMLLQHTWYHRNIISFSIDHSILSMWWSPYNHIQDVLTWFTTPKSTLIHAHIQGVRDHLIESLLRWGIWEWGVYIMHINPCYCFARSHMTGSYLDFSSRAVSVGSTTWMISFGLAGTAGWTSCIVQIKGYILMITKTTTIMYPHLGSNMRSILEWFEMASRFLSPQASEAIRKRFTMSLHWRGSYISIGIVTPSPFEPYYISYGLSRWARFSSELQGGPLRLWWRLSKNAVEWWRRVGSPGFLQRCGIDWKPKVLGTGPVRRDPTKYKLYFGVR